MDQQQLLLEFVRMLPFAIAMLAAYLLPTAQVWKSLKQHIEFSKKSINLIVERAQAQEDSMKMYHENERAILTIIRDAIAELQTSGNDLASKKLADRLNKQIDIRNTQAEQMNASFDKIVESTLAMLSVLDESLVKAAQDHLRRNVSIAIIDSNDPNTIDL